LANFVTKINNNKKNKKIKKKKKKEHRTEIANYYNNCWRKKNKERIFKENNESE
jgi:hypothetical protein